MLVSEAVARRKSVRSFTSEPVDDDTIRRLLEAAARAPSGGNVQPWRIYVVNGDTMTRFREFIADRPIEAGEYDIYPPKLWEPYRTNRFTIGEQMYATLGIDRDDKEGRMRQFARNDEFFGAPAALFCFIDRRMGPPQWSDLGMFLQTFMLLAQEAGIDTCPQEYWSVRHGAVREFVAAPEEELLFCGMAIGHADWDAPVNTLVSERMPLDEWARFV
ncbi:MAG: nitroreductase [Ilumatobacter sp.]|uniref:nitroreductase n=1 Tax=Ilumatobacter sp. TaxID=1967498 RepID=UPI002616C4E4|nr:nitroreductase [Ilumatobacter sp.]MDJ0770048.1 nitroreductase [Ilumatobacter sp.]